MRVLFIQPPILVSERWSFQAEPFLPIGLGSLAAVLRKSGHEVRILDALTEGWELRGRIDGNWIEIGLVEEDIAAEIRSYHPQVVGFSLPFTTQMPRMRSLARWVKAIHPEIFVICGGNHATISPRELLSIPEVDLVVFGEGEDTLPAILEKVAGGEDFNQIDGIAWREKTGDVVVRPRKTFSLELDDLPRPAYDLLPLKKYFKAIGGRIIPLFTARGCANNCSHCTSTQLSGTKVRCYSPEYIEKQIRHLINYYGVREFFLDDHGLFCSRENADRFFSHLKELDLRIVWTARNGVDPRFLTSELLSKMKASGGTRLHFEPDSGSRRVLKQCLSKYYTPYDVEQAAGRALKADLKVSCHFMIGLPGETLDEVYETLNFAWKLRSLGVDEFQFALAVPYAGTDLRRQAVEMECVLPATEQVYTPHDGAIETSETSSEELIEIRDTAEREFNSQGLVIGLRQRVALKRKVPRAVQERFFYSVAPQPYMLDRRSEPFPLDELSEETV